MRPVFEYARAAVAIANFTVCDCGNAAPVQVELDKSQDEAWAYAEQISTQREMSVSFGDKEGGVVEFTGSFASYADWFVCRRGRGILDAELYVIQWKLIPLSPLRTRIEIGVTGRTAWHQHRHALFVTYGYVPNYVVCESTGKVEQQLMQVISGAPP